MASKNYRQISMDDDIDLGSVSARVLIGTVTAIDPQSMPGYLHNLQLTFNMGSSKAATNPGVMFFLTTDSASFTYDEVIAAGGMVGGGKLSLSAKRSIKSAAPAVNRPDGPVSLWADAATFTDRDGNVDTAVIDLVVETWGRFVEFAFA